MFWLRNINHWVVSIKFIWVRYRRSIIIIFTVWTFQLLVRKLMSMFFHQLLKLFLAVPEAGKTVYLARGNEFNTFKIFIFFSLFFIISLIPKSSVLICVKPLENNLNLFRVQSFWCLKIFQYIHVNRYYRYLKYYNTWENSSLVMNPSLWKPSKSHYIPTK